jgi:drug/metabolite transporter (DMT)-like permease
MMGAERTALLPAGAVALSAALWGLWWLPLRALADAGLTGAALNAALYGIACVVLSPWFWRRRRRLAAGGRLLLGAGGLFGAALVSWNLALILGEVVRVTLLFYLAPVWATLLALTVLGEPVGRLRLISVALGLAGAVVLLGAGGLPLPRATGDWLGLAAGLLFALSVTLVRRGEAIEGLDQTLVSFATAALLSLTLLLIIPQQTSTVDPVVLVWAALAALGWLLPVTWLLLWGARFLEPGRVSLLLLLEVAVAAISAALLAAEPFGSREACGCLLILAAGALERAAELRPAGSRPFRDTLRPPSRTSAAGTIERASHIKAGKGSREVIPLVPWRFRRTAGSHQGNRRPSVPAWPGRCRGWCPGPRRRRAFSSRARSGSDPGTP